MTVTMSTQNQFQTPSRTKNSKKHKNKSQSNGSLISNSQEKSRFVQLDSFSTESSGNPEFKNFSQLQSDALTEIESAAHFWAQNMHATDLSEHQIRGFQVSLAKNLIKKFSGHWNPNSPLKGHAYRCIQVAHGRVDSVLLSAAKQNNIHSFKSRIPSSICMWIDPNSVEVKFLDLAPRPRFENILTVYPCGSVSDFYANSQLANPLKSNLLIKLGNGQLDESLGDGDLYFTEGEYSNSNDSNGRSRASSEDSMETASHSTNSCSEMEQSSISEAKQGTIIHVNDSDMEELFFFEFEHSHDNDNDNEIDDTDVNDDDDSQSIDSDSSSSSSGLNVSARPWAPTF